MSVQAASRQDTKQDRAQPLRRFVAGMTELVGRPDQSEKALLDEGSALLKDLLGQDDWLDDAFAAPHPEYYRQYLLFCDPLERFSVVSFVWGPGQQTPVHNHTGCLARSASCNPAPSPASRKPMAMSTKSPTRSTIACRSASTSTAAISGASSARCSTRPTATAKPFVSAYANTALPNLWN